MVYIFKKEKNKNIVIYDDLMMWSIYFTYLQMLSKKSNWKKLLELNSHCRSIVVVDDSKIRILHSKKKKFYNRISYILAWEEFLYEKKCGDGRPIYIFLN